MSGQRRRNRLAASTSPYLLQHAENPVDWFPWGDEAFDLARDRDLPVFLSVGYAACHWCHVMERESFEDEGTAAFLNEHFVSVKVDREERPDVDAIYMDAVQALTGAGGWPMSVFLTPDRRPFSAGTYFPARPSHGLPSFRQVLDAIVDAWRSRREDVEAQSSSITDAIGKAADLPGIAPLHAPSDSLADAATDVLTRAFDPRWGGFGSAPKFPQPMVLEWLLRQHVRGRPGVLEMVTRTLDGMSSGGIHDHVGGGFSRYSTDARWQVPHFEKMLYDNAQLLQVYTHAWLVTGDPHYRTVAERTAEYLEHDLQRPEGGFAASQDADSEGVEGQYYVWTYDELVTTVGVPVADAFGAVEAGNWDGTNVLWRPESTADVGARHGLPAAELEGMVDAARPTLRARRKDRVPPATDDKVITAWNGLAIRAFAIAGRSFDDPSLVATATRCADFVWEALRSDERLMRSWRAGTTGSVGGFLDDHAQLGLGYLALYEVVGASEWFQRARWLGDVIRERFVGPDGAIYQTADDAEELVFRPRDVQDNAVPSGTSAAAELLARLSMFTGDDAYQAAAERAVRAVGDLPARAPSAFGNLLSVADLLAGPPREVAIVGAPSDVRTQAMAREVTSLFLPNLVLAIGSDDGVVPLLEGRSAIGGDPTAYVCERFACQLPVTDPSALRTQLHAVAGY
jgi:uncharacterized protein YyaL (SSP411 family)